MATIRLTMAQALVKWLCAQRTIIEGQEAPLFGGVFAIFGHGNVTCLGEALEPVQDQLPTWRGQNEQSMALAGIAYAKAKRRRRWRRAWRSGARCARTGAQSRPQPPGEGLSGGTRM
jgi:3D-(3,5/4)-trihydroxycyclohexane-1,2-dione acylhydrolase (decyclizing)